MSKAPEEETLWMAHCYHLAKYFDSSGKWMAMLPAKDDSPGLQRWLWMRLWKAAHPTSQSAEDAAR